MSEALSGGSGRRGRRSTASPDAAPVAVTSALAVGPEAPGRSVLVHEKIRGFVLDRSTGRPVPGVVVLVIGIPDEGVELPLGVYTSDRAGYLSVTARGLPVVPQLLRIRPVGLDDAAIDLPAARWQGNPGPHFVLSIDGSLVECQNPPPLPSIPDPDLRDWELSPRSFAIPGDLTLGENGCVMGCERLAPSTVAERDYRIRRVVRQFPTASVPDTANNMVSLLDPANVPFDSNEQAEILLFGEVLEFRQRWYPIGHSLGELAYSLPLAPCESVNIAVLDWSRQDTAVRQDQLVASEALFHQQRRDRTIEETVNAALSESQGGWSLMAGTAQATSAQQASAGQASATVPVEGIPVNLAGAASQALGFGQLFTIGGGVANSWGNRDLSGSSLQELHDLTRQSTNVLRTLSSTVVIQTTQQEQSTVQTRTVTNHNHCHAVTMEYYEVLRHFRVETIFEGRRRVVLIPYRVATFDWNLALRFRTILEALVDARVQPCFDALVRLHLCPDIYALPAPATGTGEVGELPAGSGEPPESLARIISSFSVTLGTTTWNWSTTWGEIWVDVWLNSLGDWKTIWHKDPVGRQAPELNKITFPQLASGQMIEPADIDKVQVRWQEDNANDSWDLESITITYEISGEAGTHTLIDLTGSAVPPGSRSNQPAIRYFDDSGAQPISTAPLDVQPPPEPGESEETGGGAPPSRQPAAASGRYSRKEDQCCEQRLLAHLNANIGFYSRAIWLLQDPVERRVMLDVALAGKPWIAGGVDDTPLAVSGTHVAFPYTPANGEEEPRPVDGLPPVVEIFSLPTRGVFAEAQIGHCNSCEQRDITRFWQWEESPCPERAPTIEGIQPGPAGQPVTVTPAALPAPVVQVMNAPPAPDPVGLAAALDVIGRPDIFRDMSGMAEVGALLNGLASGAMSLADAQRLAESVNRRLGAAGAAGVPGRPAGGITTGGPAAGGPAAGIPTEPDAGRQVDKLDAIEYGLEKKLLDEEGARRAAEGVVGGRRPEPSVSPLEELEEAGQKPAEGVLGGINADARLKESYDLLISEGWELRRRNIFIGNSDVDEDRKLLFIDDDPEPVATTTEWATDVVRKAYQGDDDLRRRAIRDKAIAIFSDAGLTDLEKMARTYEWAVWFWRFPFDTGDPVELLDDMMLVLTDLEPSGLSLNDGTYHIFRAGRAARANSTGFKYAFRDDSNQVRHATGSIQGSLTFGPAGFGFLQLREDSDSADWRLNSRCFDIAEGLKFRLPNFLARDIGAVLRRELGDPAQTGPWTGPPDGDPNAPMP